MISTNRITLSNIKIDFYFLFKIKYITSLMTHTIKHSNDELRTLLSNILSYEPFIYNQIMRSVFYPMKDSNELREAVKLWLTNESIALKTYGHISLWNTYNVTDMSSMFYDDSILMISVTFEVFQFPIS